MWFAYLKDMIMNQRTIPVDALESEAIYILREVLAQFEKPVLLFSGGKDSITLVRLAQKAFYPAKVPFPLLHIDTGHNFPETIEFRDRLAKELDLELIVRNVQDNIDKGVVKEETGRYASRNILQTQTFLMPLKNLDLMPVLVVRVEMKKRQEQKNVFFL